MSELNAITVDVVSDVVCPWCFIGQKRLDAVVN
ncbi:DsbA family protein, partial [Mesorhizobium sp. M7A.F.Ca.CA.002.07.1.1]